MFKELVISKFLSLPLAQKTALITSAICFCASIILILASYQMDRQLIHHSSQLFAESLAKQLARDASNPLVQSDKLSLQSLLKKLVESPLVVHGAIYDVANKPLAEAGAEQNEGQSLSASITFQDSIAGYAVITLDTTPLQYQARMISWQLLLLALLLSGLCYLLSFFPARYISSIIKDLSVIASIPSSKRRSNLHTSYPGDDELQQLAKRLIAGPKQVPASKGNSNQYQDRAVVAIELVNLKELSQHCTPQQLAELLSELQQQLAMICQLYTGELCINGSNKFYIIFKPNDEKDSYPFRALCSGQLIMQWQQALPLLLRAGLALEDQAPSPIILNDFNQQLGAQIVVDRAMAIANVDNQLVAENSLYQHPSVNSRVVITKLRATNDADNNGNDAPVDKVIIEKLAAPYDALLKQQLSTLQTKIKKHGSPE